jgi:putative transposase
VALYKYINGILTSKKCIPYQINGIEDHIHIMSDLHPGTCLSNFVKDIKLATGNWMKESKLFPAFDQWQDGYGAFTYSIREKDKIINYIKNQKQHHLQENFYDEYKRLLIENGVGFDE